MFRLLFRIALHEDELLPRLSAYHKVAITAYPVLQLPYKDHSVVLFSCTFQRDVSGRILDDLKVDSRISYLEHRGKSALIQTKIDGLHRTLFQTDIFHVRPIILDKYGNSTYTLGSLTKENLANRVDIYKKFWGANILNLDSVPLSPPASIYPPVPMTYKQRQVLTKAIDLGYYDFRRRTTLKKLAEASGISYSTFQFHLQNAEKKTMNLFRNIM